MGAFARIMKYVWPQWPRIVVIVISVLIIAVLFAGSFATVIPLLKVMMGRESIPTWIDRKICDWRYEIGFYVPEGTDFENDRTIDNARYVLITNVKDDKLAYIAGLKREDKIVSLNTTSFESEVNADNLNAILSTISESTNDSVLYLNLKCQEEAGSSSFDEIEFTVYGSASEKVSQFNSRLSVWQEDLEIKDASLFSGVIKTYTNNGDEITKRANILNTLAQTSKDGLTGVHILRPDEDGRAVENDEMLIYLPTFSMVDGTDLDSGATEFKIGIVNKLAGLMPDSLGGSTKEKAVFWIIVFMGFVTITRCTARFLQQFLAEKVVQVAVAKLREEAFAHAMNMPIGYFVKRGSSDTVSRLIGDINGIGGGIKILLGKAIREPAKAIMCLGAAMMISWQLVLIFIGLAPVTIGLAAILGKRIKKHTRKMMQSGAVMLAKLHSAIGSLRVVKVYNQQETENKSYEQMNNKLLRQILKTAKIDAITDPVMEVLGMIAGSSALLVGVHWITNQYNGMEPEDFFGLLILLGTSAESIRKASDVWNKAQKANAAAERVFAVLNEPAEYEKQDAFELKTLSSKIEFKDVCFTYPGSEKPVLNGVNLVVQAGHNVAIVGSNGSGKTTLVNLIPRFYNPDSGSILIDGQDIMEGTLKSLRSQIAMVTQNVVTFNDTIANNIAYGRPDATMDEIIDAAKRSYAHEFIEPLPDGYNTIIGEQGAGLSGGQLQRIVIARAILKNPPILIFDEATSQIDAKSEALIHNATQEIMKDRTSFIIAHRFSTVVSADTIAVMDAGKIIAQGTHAELMDTCSLYQSLYENQLMQPEEE